MTNIKLRPISIYVKHKTREIRYFVDNPIEVQQKLLMQLVKTARHTEWGVLNEYGNIHNSSDFNRRIQVQDYTSLKPQIERILRGENNVLWPGKTRWFAKSSGTTSSRSKFIPISKEALVDCHFKAGKELLSVIYKIKPDCKIHRGYGITLGGSSSINVLNNNSHIGDLSAILMENLPSWTKMWQKPDIKTLLIPDWEDKLEKISRKTLDKKITHITGVPTWTIVLINKLIEMSGKGNLMEIWPDMEIYIHGGVSFKPYRGLFNKLIPKPDMLYLETYNASEGFFGIQDEQDKDDMILLLNHGIYYEFIPMKDVDSDCPNTLNLSEVELNKNYAIVITTNSGLWRYKIGDTIRFTSLFPFRFQITGRTKNFINAFGEELIIENAEKAITTACNKTHSEITDYTVAPVYFSENNHGTHQWIVEFKKEPEDFDSFCKILDESLKEVNSDYEAKRYKDLALTAPVITKVAEGTFYQWMKMKGKLGGQNKVPRLSDSREYVDDILEWMKRG